MKNVFKRGIPNQDSKIHFMPKGSPEHYPVDCDNTACYTGSYHIFYSFDRSFVTCEECKKNLKKGI